MAIFSVQASNLTDGNELKTAQQINSKFRLVLP